MVRLRPLLLLAALVLGACDSSAPPTLPEGPPDLSRRWTEVDPEAVGIDPAALSAADAQMEDIARSRCLLVIRDGKLVHERYFHGASSDSRHDVRSVTKSVVGMLTGIAIEEGHLSLDTPIGPYLTGLVEDMEDAEAAITVRDLLTMTGGWEWNESSGNDYGNWIASLDHVRYLFERPLATEPGTTFRYNSAAVHVLGVVLEEARVRRCPLSRTERYSDRSASVSGTGRVAREATSTGALAWTSARATSPASGS